MCHVTSKNLKLHFIFQLCEILKNIWPIFKDSKDPRPAPPAWVDKKEIFKTAPLTRCRQAARAKAARWRCLAGVVLADERGKEISKAKKRAGGGLRFSRELCSPLRAFWGPCSAWAFRFHHKHTPRRRHSIKFLPPPPPSPPHRHSRPYRGVQCCFLFFCINKVPFLFSFENTWFLEHQGARVVFF